MSLPVHDAVNSHPIGVVQYHFIHAAIRLMVRWMSGNRPARGGAGLHAMGMHGMFMTAPVSHGLGPSNRHTAAESPAVQMRNRNLYWLFFAETVTVRDVAGV